MKLRTVLGLGTGLAVGYVLGTAAGRTRFEQLKRRASELASDPKVQQTVSDIAGQVKTNAHHVPGPVSGIVGQAAGKIQETLSQQSQPGSSEPTPGSPSNL